MVEESSGDHDCKVPDANSVDSAEEVKEIETEHDWKLKNKEDYGGGLLTIMECEKCDAQKATILTCEKDEEKEKKS